MTMDFSAPPGPGSTMGQLAEAALNATHGQLASLYPEYGIHLRAEQVWQRLGATAMIGQNDKRGENFTVSDARSLAGFAAQNHLGRRLHVVGQPGHPVRLVLLRDRDALRHLQRHARSPACSSPRSSASCRGTRWSRRARATSSPPWPTPTRRTRPYPQWSATASYPLGYKVVENGEIYQAKWYNSGDDPSAQVQYSWQTPWELLGPVVPGSRGAVIPTLSAGTYPAWSVGTQYQAGDKVLYQGLPYAGQVVQPGRLPRHPVDRPVGLGVEGAVQHPR